LAADGILGKFSIARSATCASIANLVGKNEACPYSTTTTRSTLAAHHLHYLGYLEGEMQTDF
jgi:hypothetical protein